ncbi:transcription initiation factor IIE [Herbivorax sp. ANBcel31]|uniref:transcription initiation factor IIE n=1 Tax=Herbivorax sp. ANBcel31 TaxID=3069754 RepID=UPI0027B56D24|nr:transcription initiation factor IIE [Herbivorax sp. ANBcel31]MDQ2085970.1 transcription initiation factor IIE [Herbivorax sp. ANBcel31]
MKYQQDFIGSKSEFAEFIKKTFPELFAEKLNVEGKTVVIPGDKELNYKLKFTEDNRGASFLLKASWDNEIEEEDDDDDDDEMYVD